MQDYSLHFLLVFAVATMAAVAFGVVALILRKRAGRLRPVLAGLFFMALAVAGFSGLRIFVLGVPFATKASPYGNHYLQYYKFPRLLGSPGGGSDFSGKVKLKNHYGKTLATADFSIYQEVYDPQWSENEVRVGSSLHWQF